MLLSIYYTAGRMVHYLTTAIVRGDASGSNIASSMSLLGELQQATALQVYNIYNHINRLPNSHSRLVVPSSKVPLPAITRSRSGRGKKEKYLIIIYLKGRFYHKVSGKKRKVQLLELLATLRYPLYSTVSCRNTHFASRHLQELYGKIFQ